MFTVDTLVDNAATQTKNGLVFVQNETVRNSLETVVDASAEYFKTIYNTSITLGKTAYESLNALAPKTAADKK
jgi:hypothetical protein